MTIAKVNLDEIFEQMDFDRIRKAMLALNWKWRGEEDSPTIAQMKECVRDLANTVNRRGYRKGSTGGFTVWRDEYGSFGCYFAIEDAHFQHEGS